MTWRGSLVAALLATLVHPRWWLLALAGFLVRGGVLIVLLPIVAPPTVAGLLSFLAPSLIGQIISGGPRSPRPSS
jgi:ABC-type molybdate transport system permease subunit